MIGSTAAVAFPAQHPGESLGDDRPDAATAITFAVAEDALCRAQDAEECAGQAWERLGAEREQMHTDVERVRAGAAEQVR
ncbi:hypothetical protein [Planobispora rosea]|uniref:hypothetical protein n=1 Tax=Planobispora rosea TaxID=35762 RepID=UPI00083A3126|nr:hypothetical protein [Planobispora rosea]